MGSLEITTTMSLLSLIVFFLAFALVRGEGCGVRYFSGSHAHTLSSKGYIVGGSAARRGSLPWQVSVHLYGHFCGGTIIDKRWILSAAHCFPKGYFNGQIVIGEHDLHKTEGSEQRIEVERVIRHPLYNNRNSDNDIALLRLKEDIRFDSYAQPACLPLKANQEVDYAAGSNAIISGWGSTKARSGPMTLQVAMVPMISDNTCRQMEYYGWRLTKSMFCAGKLGEGGVDSCQGDSGGPLVRSIKGKFTVLGVVSWGQGCGRPNKPGVYTHVAKFESWIKSTMGKWH